jgi:hypothetical protein
MIEQTPKPVTFNHIHKRFMVIYHLSDMRRVWKKVRSEWKKETKTELPKRFKKYPEVWSQLNIWIEEKIKTFVNEGGQDIVFYNKADLKDRGWDEKLIKLLYPNPDKVIYLGRGRYAYYYNGTNLGEIEDSEDFIEYIAIKLEKKRKRDGKKALIDNPKTAGFGSEFIR